MRIYRVNYDCRGDKNVRVECEQNDVMVVAETMEEAIRKADKYMKTEWKGVFGYLKAIECFIEHDIEVI